MIEVFALAIAEESLEFAEINSFAVPAPPMIRRLFPLGAVPTPNDIQGSNDPYVKKTSLTEDN